MMISTLSLFFALTMEQQASHFFAPPLRQSWPQRPKSKRQLSALSSYHPKNRRFLAKGTVVR